MSPVFALAENESESAVTVVQPAADDPRQAPDDVREMAQRLRDAPEDRSSGQLSREEYDY